MFNKLLKKFNVNKISMWNPNTNYLVYLNHFKKIMDYCLDNKDFRLNYQTWLSILNSDNPGSKIGSETHNVCQALNVIESEYLYRTDKEPSEIKIHIPREFLYQYVIDNKELSDEFYNIIAKRYFELLKNNNIFQIENLEHVQRVALNLFVCYLKDTNKMDDDEIANYINFAKSSSNDVINKINKVYLYDICKENSNLLDKLKITSNHNESSNTKLFLESLLNSVVDEEEKDLEDNVNNLREFYIQNIKNNDYIESMIKDREKFILEYPIQRILTLTLEEYCLGLEGYRDSFCNKLEKGEYAHTGFGIGGANSSKFGIYFKKDGNFHGKNDILIDNPDVYWQEYKQQLYDFIVEMGTAEPNFEIDKKYKLLGGSGGYMYLTKLLSLYYPDRFIAMSKNEAYERLNDYLGIPNRDNAVLNSYYSNIAFRDYVPESNNYFGYYISNAVWKFFKMTEKEVEKVESISIIDESSRVKNAYNKIFYGVPGCGKSYTVNKEFNKDVYNIQRTTFHPEYTNSDFVGQIIPKLIGSAVSYEFHPGAFAKTLLYALKHPSEKVCLIIEEINRGNASSIFGDIFQLLDRDENGKSRYTIFNSSLIDYLNKNGVSIDEIYIPSNMWIVATMNTCDQNVFTLDTAFKRRWKMEYIKNIFATDAESQKLKNTKIPFNGKYNNITWGDFVTKINKHILADKSGINSEDKQLGMYFVSIEEINSPKEFAEKVLSYLWEDVAKLNTEYWFGDIESYDELLRKYDENYLKIFDTLFDEEINVIDDINIKMVEQTEGE